MIEIKRNAQKSTQTAQKRPLQPFTALDGSNYRAAYRAVCELHERHNPPRTDVEYWDEIAADMERTAKAYKEDPFVMDMLIAVQEELERQAKKLID